MRFRPIDYVDRLSPRALLLTCVEDDSVTPESHAIELFERAGQPKRLVRQSGTTHYASYQDNYAVLAAEIVDWFDMHLDGSLVQVRDG
jgi:dipeptidyl aminopeptidase/acylaminoacyl peptidase